MAINGNKHPDCPLPIDAGVLLVKDKAALARVTRPFLGLPTLRRSALALQRQGVSQLLVCVPDTESEKICAPLVQDIAQIVVGTARLVRSLEEIGVVQANQVLIMDTDLVIAPDTLKTFVAESGGGASRVI